MRQIRVDQLSGGVGCTTVSVALASMLGDVVERTALVSDGPDALRVAGMQPSDLTALDEPLKSYRVRDGLRFFEDPSEVGEADFVVYDGARQGVAYPGSSATVLVVRNCYLALSAVLDVDFDERWWDCIVCVTDDEGALPFSDCKLVLETRCSRVVKLPRTKRIATLISAGLFLDRGFSVVASALQPVLEVIAPSVALETV